MPISAASSKVKSTPSNAEALAALRLARTDRIGPRTYHALIEAYGSAAHALDVLPSISQKPITAYPLEKAERELARITAFGARVLIHGTPEYPELLAAIEDAPPVIIVKGNVELLHQPMVAMVGARNSSANGCRFAETLSRELGQAGYVIVSGLARGIDTAAHKASLATGTVAVIAGGIDTIYPPENKKLQEQIFEEGIVVSELPFGNAPRAEHFPQRNRIIAGLSKGTVIVEAAMRSGSLITARLANEQGREVFAVPGSPMDARAEGPNRLLKQGATVVTSSQDILNVLSTPLSRPNFRLREPAAEPYKPKPAPVTDTLEREILAHLNSAPLPVDDLLALFPDASAEVSLALLKLELAGKLERQPGGKLAVVY